MATQIDLLTMRITALETEKAQVDLKFNDAATRILGLESDMRDLRKLINDTSTKKEQKEILESRAIQNLGKMKEAKEYRSWNLKMRNAFDQARATHGKKVLTWLETVTEKAIDEEQENDPTLSSLEWIKEIYKRNTVAKYSGISDEAFEGMNRDLWAVLIEKCENEAMQKVSSTLHGEGMKAYVRLHQWFNKTTELGKTNRIIDIMRPDACKHDYEIANAI